MYLSNRFDTRALGEKKKKDDILLYLKMVRGVVKRLLWARNSWPGKSGKEEVHFRLRECYILRPSFWRTSKGSGQGATSQICIFRIDQRMGYMLHTWTRMFAYAHVSVWILALYFFNNWVLPIQHVFKPYTYLTYYSFFFENLYHLEDRHS